MKISVLVRNQEQLDVVKNYPCDMIYTDNLELAKKYPEIFYQVARVKEESDLPDNILISDIGRIFSLKDKKIVVDYYMNVANSKTIEVLLKLGVEKINVSLELEDTLLKQITNLDSYPIEILVYGRIEDMILKQHPIFNKNGYSIKDYEGKLYPIYKTKNGVSIFHYEPINRLDKISFYRDLGINCFRIDFLEEGQAEIECILQNVFKN